MTKKLLPKIKAITPEVAVAEERKILIEWTFDVCINGESLYLEDYIIAKNHFDAMKNIRQTLTKIYEFMNVNLGTHYVVKNDTESNLKDLGY